MNKPDERIEKYKNVTDLRKYDREFRVTNDGTNSGDGVEEIWELCIMGKYGQIYPCGFNGDLAVSVTSPKVATKVASVLEGRRVPGRGNQGGGFSSERSIRFPHDPALVRQLAILIRASRSRKGKGRKFTPEQIAANVARLKAWREANKKRPAPQDSTVSA